MMLCRNQYVGRRLVLPAVEVVLPAEGWMYDALVQRASGNCYADHAATA
jgi:hypothetical protein